jgi:iron complex outermembrane receptor protein
LRATWGKSGNQPQQSNLSGSLMSQGGSYFYNSNYLPSYYIAREENPNLKWEEKTEINIGADFTLLNNRISGSVDWFTNSVNNFYTLYTDYSFNSVRDSRFVNFGEIQNTGVEFNAEVSAIDNTKFKWAFNLNLATIYTKVASLKGDGFAYGTDQGGRFIPNYQLSGPGSSAPGLNLIQEGAPPAQIYGLMFEGVNPDGTANYKDVNGDRFKDDRDAQVIGNGLPNLFLGWGNRLCYQRFELSFFFRGAFGHQKINSYRALQENEGLVGSWNLIKSPYSISGLRSDYFSDRYVENASFLKLDNISVKYHVPSSFNLTLFATAQNLFTITSYSGFDAEVAYPNPTLKGGTRVYVPYPNQLTAGIEARGNYLPSRIFSIGASLKF